MHSAFRSPAAGTRYIAVTAATFLPFTTPPSLPSPPGACRSCLSRVLASVGFDPGQTGPGARSGALAGPCLSLALMIGGMGRHMPGAFLLVHSCIVPERLMQFGGIYGAM